MRALRALKKLGFTLEAVGHQVRVDYPAPRPPRAALPLLQELRRRKPEVLRALSRSGRSTEPDVTWRVTAMQSQVPGRGAVPSLIARPHTRRPGYCFSCGELEVAHAGIRCAPCAEAAWRVVCSASVRTQGVH